MRGGVSGEAGDKKQKRSSSVGRFLRKFRKTPVYGHDHEACRCEGCEILRRFLGAVGREVSFLTFILIFRGFFFLFERGLANAVF